MSEKEQPPIMDQKLCVNGCGFFGSSQTSHMCSKCWKDAMSKTMRDADANSDGAGSSTAFQPDTKPSMEEVVAAAAASSTLPSKQHLQTGSDSPLQQVPPPPSPATNTPATPRSPSDETMMAVDTASDITALPPPPIVGTNATPTPMVEEEEVLALNAAALEAAETPMVPRSPMAVCEGNQTDSATAFPVGAGTMAAVAGAAAVGAAAGVAVTGAVVAGAAAGAAASAATATVAAGSATPAIASVAVGAVVAEAAVAAAAEMSAIRPAQKSRKRCFTCNKKVGYTGIACRCNYVFCSLHRYPEQHDCTFDFKSSDREDLKRTVVGGGQFSKLDRV